MGLYVIETDALCLRCGEEHGVVTTMCNLSVFVDYASARWVSKGVEGSAVREIEAVPEGLSAVIYLHKNGRPDRAYPRTVAKVSGN
jgi:hypothetical protein